MTLKTESPISIDHTINRIYHQHHHHHHYHLHHILDHHHHLHIYNQSLFKGQHLSQQQQQQQLQDHHQQHDQCIQQHDTNSIHSLSRTPSVRSLTMPAMHDAVVQHHDQEDISQQQQRPMIRHDNDESGISNQLVQSRRLTHVLGAQNQLICSPTATTAAASAIHSRRQSGTTTGAKSKQRSQIQFLLLSAFAYILSPIDIIPEAIFGIFGIVDDLVFLIMCLFCVAIILLYPLFREMRRTFFDKLGLKQQCEEGIIDNKNI